MDAAQLAKLKKLAQRYIDWQALGCQVEDAYDTYPSDLWDSFASPGVVLELIACVEATAALEAEGPLADWLATRLTPGQRENVLDAMARGESHTADAFRAGWHAACAKDRQPRSGAGEEVVTE